MYQSTNLLHRARFGEEEGRFGEKQHNTWDKKPRPKTGEQIGPSLNISQNNSNHFTVYKKYKSRMDIHQEVDQIEECDTPIRQNYYRENYL